MTTLRLKRRSSRKASAMGLVLSMGLIFGATEILRLNASEREVVPSGFDEACELPVDSQHAGWIVAPSAVPPVGQGATGRSL